MNDYDIAIISGGIHGAGTAQACAAAGYNTIVIEQADWAAGTSSKSTKLIHGGLRYLESWQLSLVYHSLQERNILLRNAPSLVHPLEFVIPIYKTTRRRPWELFTGLGLYSLLAGLSPLSRFKASREKPNAIKPDKFQMAFSYWDAQTDDQALTRAIISSAKKYGATTLAPATVIQAHKNNSGYQLDIDIRGSIEKINCQVLINSAGPWINQVMQRISPTPIQYPIELFKGSHLILQGQIDTRAYYLESPIDQRVIFILPWQGNTLLGTTEELFTGDPAKAKVSPSEVDYLLATAQYYFPQQNFNIIDQYAGVRVLPLSEGKAFSRARETVLHQDKQHPRLISLYGGKLTTYRGVAEKTAKLAAKIMGDKKPVMDTKLISLEIQ